MSTPGLMRKASGLPLLTPHPCLACHNPTWIVKHLLGRQPLACIQGKVYVPAPYSACSVYTLPMYSTTGYSWRVSESCWKTTVEAKLYLDHFTKSLFQHPKEHGWRYTKMPLGQIYRSLAFSLFVFTISELPLYVRWNNYSFLSPRTQQRQ